MNYREMAAPERQALYDALWEQYREVQAKGFALDMSRGKPCPEQLDLSLPIYADNAYIT